MLAMIRLVGLPADATEVIVSDAAFAVASTLMTGGMIALGLAERGAIGRCAVLCVLMQPFQALGEGGFIVGLVLYTLGLIGVGASLCRDPHRRPVWRRTAGLTR